MSQWGGLMKRTRDQKLEGSYFTASRTGKEFVYWVHIPFAEGWVAAQQLAVQDGVIVVSELRVFPKERLRAKPREWSGAVASVPRGGLSASLLRSVSIGGHAVAPVVTDWLESKLFSRPDRLGVAVDWEPAARSFARLVERDLSVRIEPPRPPTEAGRRGRKPTRDRKFYEGIAADYIRLFREGPARQVAKRLADERSKAEKREVNRRTVRTWIHIARNTYGLLPTTTMGNLPSGPLLSPSGARRRRRAKKNDKKRKKTKNVASPIFRDTSVLKRKEIVFGVPNKRGYPILQCICGHKFGDGKFVISSHGATHRKMPCCKTELRFDPPRRRTRSRGPS